MIEPFHGQNSKQKHHHGFQKSGKANLVTSTALNSILKQKAIRVNQEEIDEQNLLHLRKLEMAAASATRKTLALQQL